MATKGWAASSLAKGAHPIPGGTGPKSRTRIDAQEKGTCQMWWLPNKYDCQLQVGLWCHVTNEWCQGTIKIALQLGRVGLG